MKKHSFLMEKLVKYRAFINIITILLLLLLPLTGEKLTLLFFMVLFLALFQFFTCLNYVDFINMWDLVVQALLAVIYILICTTVLLRSLYIIKRRLGTTLDRIFSIVIGMAGLYSLHAVLQYPDMFSFAWLALFFIFNIMRWMLITKADY
ncbi:hypothetical protein AAW12_02690 [Sphingobacterium sp. Ag1]|nr:hypothetical protein AAW12_02690 [Sphingobacterium sp. Ag1]